MPRADVSDLFAFLAVARERSFTKAAGQLGVHPGAAIWCAMLGSLIFSSAASSNALDRITDRR